MRHKCFLVFFFQAEDGIRDLTVTGVQTCDLPICDGARQEALEGQQHVERQLDEYGLEVGHDLRPGRGQSELESVERHHRAGQGELWRPDRSEEHTSELQSQSNLVCRLLLEKKKNT